MSSDNELLLINKIIEEEEIYKPLNADIGRCLTEYQDVYEFIQGYYFKYKSVPSIEILEKKFGTVDKKDVSGYTTDFLIDEIQNEYIKSEAGDIVIEAAKILEFGDPKEGILFAFDKLSNIISRTQTVKDVDLAKDYHLRVNSLKERAASAEERGGVLGIRSSVPAIDYIFGGFQRGDFVVLMGWTGSAKTWLATYFATEAWKQGHTVLYISLEMDDKQFGYRFDTLVAGGKFSNIALMNGRGISIDEYEGWATENFTDKSPFHLVTNETMEEATQLTVQSKIEQYRPDIVFIDYHGLLDDARRGRNETEKHKNLSRDFKKIAGRYGVPIIDIAGVTMEDGHGQRLPRLDEIAWAKALAYDSDLVLSMYKEGNVVHVGAEKVRRGDMFAFTITWNFDSGVLNLHDWD